jgi:hypothetical protein
VSDKHCSQTADGLSETLTLFLENAELRQQLSRVGLSLQAAIEREREACARLAEQLWEERGIAIAHAIRARLD